MSSIEVKSALRIQLKEILDGVSNLDTPDLENFLVEVGHLLAQRKGKNLPKREAELLLKINISLLSKDKQEKYSHLYSKLQEETITSEEHQVLLTLIKEREAKGTERIVALIELAQIRKIALKDLLKTLGIHSLSDAA